MTDTFIWLKGGGRTELSTDFTVRVALRRIERGRCQCTHCSTGGSSPSEPRYSGASGRYVFCVVRDDISAGFFTRDNQYEKWVC